MPLQKAFILTSKSPYSEDFEEWYTLTNKMALKRVEVVLISAMILITAIGLNRSCNVELNETYVIGKQVKRVFGGETGYDWTYQYQYKGKVYDCSFTDSFTEMLFTDSLLFIKIDSMRPAHGWPILDCSVPIKFRTRAAYNSSFKETPCYD